MNGSVPQTSTIDVNIGQQGRELLPKQSIQKSYSDSSSNKSAGKLDHFLDQGSVAIKLSYETWHT